MNPKRKVLLALLKVADLTTVSASLVAALIVVKGSFDGMIPTNVPVSASEAIAATGYLAFWHFVLEARGLYESRRLSPTSSEMRDLMAAVALAIVPAFPVCLLYWPSPAGLAVPVVFGVFAFAALGLERTVLRAIARQLRRSRRNLRSVIIVGAGDAAFDLTGKLARREEYGFRAVAVIDASLSDGGGVVDTATLVDRVQAVIEQQPIDEVFVVLPLDLAQPVVRALILVCEEQGITVRLVAQVAEPKIGHAVVDEIDGLPVLTVTTDRSDPIAMVVKRAVDIAAAAVGLVLLLPLFAIVAVLIKLDSPGPVFFAQQRVGYNRRRFAAYKLRTMVPDAENLQAALESRNEADGPVFKIQEDPRVTKLGRTLRSTSIDELPQLFNVLKGDMSLVGPRPLPVRDVDRMTVRWHKRRFSVKPGITCLWQVNSRRPQFDEWARWDMQYIDNWSLALDLKILARTVPAVISRQGAC